MMTISLDDFKGELDTWTGLSMAANHDGYMQPLGSETFWIPVPGEQDPFPHC